jgi:ABC-2 type transport system ATP-binding protein
VPDIDHPASSGPSGSSGSSAATLSASELAAVEVIGLRKSYHGRAAVAGLDLMAQRGAVTAVLGPNGAGKTTTVEICEGLRSPDAGTVRVLGLPPGDSRLRSRVGVMLQEGGVYGTISTREAVRHAAALYRNPHHPDELIAALGLQDVASLASRRLSGGQKQRLSLALAIVGRPEVVFLDEPTAGLDPHSRRTVWELIESLRSSGVGVLLTTHYLEEAEHLADHVEIVDEGRSIAAGRPSELVAGPQGSTQSILHFTAPASLDLGGLVSVLPAGCSAREISPGSYEICTPRLGSALAMVTTWFATIGVEPTSIKSEQRTLEDVFLELTAESGTP